MAVDWLRSCYSTKVAFFANRPDILVTVRWYRCKPTAQNFPGYTRFASGNWAYERASWPGVGEVLDSPRPWDSGWTPATANGQNFCGSLQEFRDGLVYPPAGPPVLYDSAGIPTCCAGAGPPTPDDDVRDINFWKQVGTSPIEVLYTGGSVTGENPTPAAADANLIHALPFFPARGGSLDKLGIWLETAGSTGAVVNCAIYQAESETNILPEALVAQTDNLAADGTPGQWLLADIVVDLDRTQLYWLCVNANNVTTMPVIGAMTSVYYFNVLGFSSTSFSAFFGLKVPFSYGAFPTNFPAVDNSMLANGSIAAAAVRYSN